MPSSALLAFGFVNPLLLWGLLLAGVPLLIQWLHRRRYTKRVWAAMRFLAAATQSQTRRLRMESLLLLCVRTMILLLVAAALAEPVLDSSPWLGPTATAMHTLVLFDTSLSMQAEIDGRTIGERAKEAARGLVSASRPGDSFQWLTIAANPQAVIRQPAFSRDDVLAEIGRINVIESLADVPATVVEAQRMLDEAPAESRKRVAVISDFQQSNWELEDPAALERTRTALADIAREATVSLVPVGAADIGNAAVIDARLDSPVVTTGVPISITAQVRNFGPDARRQQRLQLVEDGRVLQTQLIDLPAYGEITTVFATQWAEPGIHGLQLRLEDDVLAADNQRWLTIEVKDDLSVLLVNGRESDQTLSRATDFVELALRPSLTSGFEGDALPRSGWMIEPTVIREAALARTDLSLYDCVFLCDVPFLSDDEMARLERFVRGGGGLVISLGDQVQLDAYTRQLSGDGAGMMPVRLQRVVGDAQPDAEPFHFAEPTMAHPITRPFAGNPRSGFTTANISRYVETNLSMDSPVRTAIAFSHGAAAILEHDYGAGRVLLVTTSLDDRWGNWALWPSFLPMMHELVAYAISGPGAERTIVGQSIQIEWPPQAAVGQTVDVQRPDGRRKTLRLTDAERSSSFSVGATSHSGLYRVTIGPPADEDRLFAVNIDPRESDLRILRERDFQESILGAIGFELTDPTASTRPTSQASAPASSFAGWLLLAALVLLLVEQLMAWNGRYGVIALVISPVLLLGLQTLPAVSVFLLAAGLIALSVWRGWQRTRGRATGSR